MKTNVKWEKAQIKKGIIKEKQQFWIHECWKWMNSQMKKDNSMTRQQDSEKVFDHYRHNKYLQILDATYGAA